LIARIPIIRLVWLSLRGLEMSLGIAKRVCQLRTALENGVITLGRFHTRPLESVGLLP